KLFDGGDYLAAAAELMRSEFAILELAGPAADPAFEAGRDRRLREAGGTPYIRIDVATYLDAARRNGSLAMPIPELPELDVAVRQIDDVALARALGLRAVPVRRPESACTELTPEPAVVAAPAGGAIVGGSEEPVELALSRFVPELPMYELGTLGPGEWARLEIPGPDAAEQPWMVFFDQPMRMCPLP
ncbi:MAG: hypothetical protein ABWY90_04415, partial [Solirubrobacterales bacterium]